MCFTCMPPGLLVIARDGASAVQPAQQAQHSLNTVTTEVGLMPGVRRFGDWQDSSNLISYSI